MCPLDPYLTLVPEANLSLHLGYAFASTSCSHLCLPYCRSGQCNNSYALNRATESPARLSFHSHFLLTCLLLPTLPVTRPLRNKEPQSGSL